MLILGCKLNAAWSPWLSYRCVGTGWLTRKFLDFRGASGILICLFLNRVLITVLDRFLFWAVYYYGLCFLIKWKPSLIYSHTVTFILENLFISLVGTIMVSVFRIPFRLWHFISMFHLIYKYICVELLRQSMNRWLSEIVDDLAPCRAYGMLLSIILTIIM